MKLLKAGACFCVIVGVLVAGVYVIPRIFLDDYIVKDKHVEQLGTTTEYRILAKQASGFGYDTSYPKSFYESALVGDHLRLSPGGYSQLIRKNRVVSWRVERLLIDCSVYALIAFFTAVAFLRAERESFQWFVRLCAGAAELIVVGGLTYYLFFVD